jgi:hypothetical protein
MGPGERLPDQPQHQTSLDLSGGLDDAAGGVGRDGLVLELADGEDGADGFKGLHGLVPPPGKDTPGAGAGAGLRTWVEA